jgi:hypothetical protein
MADYLDTLRDEYADNYSDLDYRQRYDRAVQQHHLGELAATNSDFGAGEVLIDQAWQQMLDSCPRLTDLIDGGVDYTKKFRLPLRYLIKHLWSVRQAKPNILFDERTVQNFESALQDALDAVDNSPAGDEADDGVTSSP